MATSRRHFHFLRALIVITLVFAFIVTSPTITRAIPQGSGGQPVAPEVTLSDTTKPIEVVNNEQARDTGAKTGTTYLETSVLTSFNAVLGGMGQQVLYGQPVSYGTAGGAPTTYAPGAIGSTVSMTMSTLGHPPVSSREYIADLLQNASHPFAPSAYAQGLGFSSLSPVLVVWKIFRDLAYFFFVIIFVIVGFLIMIRSKIGSQAAVTVQQALPKLVISLILVTFSYAIAGLLLDAMYLVIFLMIGVFTPYISSTALNGQTLTNLAFDSNIITNTFALIGNGVVGNIAGAIGNIAVSTLGLKQEWLSGMLVQGAANVIVTLVLAIAILVAIFRVFFALLQAYVGIFFSVIFAPMQFLLGALSGPNATLGKWIRGLLENLLVFPTIILLFFIAYLFTDKSSQIKNGTFTSGASGFTAPQLGNNQGSGGFAAYQSLLALGVILAMPEVLKVTKGLMKGELGVGIDDLKKNFLAGAPLGTRVGLAGLSGGLGAGLGTLNSVRKDGFNLREMRKGFSAGGAAGLKRGVSAGSFISRAVGANQPDALNPVANWMDKRSDPEELKKQERIQMFEEMLKANTVDADEKKK